MQTYENICITQAHPDVLAQRFAIADIRDPQTFQQGHFSGAININNDNLASFILEHTNTPVLVVCYKGVSSQKAAQYIQQQGVKEVYSLMGGMAAWLEEYGAECICTT